MITTLISVIRYAVKMQQTAVRKAASLRSYYMAEVQLVTILQTFQNLVLKIKLTRCSEQVRGSKLFSEIYKSNHYPIT